MLTMKKPTLEEYIEQRLNQEEAGNLDRLTRTRCRKVCDNEAYAHLELAQRWLSRSKRFNSG